MENFEYFDKLSNPDHEFGGGSTAAVSGAMAAALILKAYNLLAKKDAELDNKVGHEFYKEVESLKSYFKNMIVMDGQTFGQVIEALKIQTENDEQRHERNEKIQLAYKDSFQIPYDIMIHVIRLFDYIYRIKDYSNKMADSELLSAKAQIVACFNVARVNTAINLAFIKDRDFIEQMKLNIGKIEQHFVYNTKKFDILFVNEERN